MSDSHSQQASSASLSERQAIEALTRLKATSDELLLALSWAMRESDLASLRGVVPVDEESGRWQLLAALARADASERTTPLEIIWGPMSARQRAEGFGKVQHAFNARLNPCQEIRLPLEVEWAGGGESFDGSSDFIQSLSFLIPILVISRLPKPRERVQEPLSRFISRFAQTLPEFPSKPAQRMIRDAFSPLFEQALLEAKIDWAPRFERLPRL